MEKWWITPNGQLSIHYINVNNIHTSPILDCRGKILTFDHPRICGILNITPDSFSDGGKFLDVSAALNRALAMVEEGADIIDVGGESTRPGATAVSVTEEIDRVIPVIEQLTKIVSIPISIDTSKPEVMRAAVRAGAGIINDVYGLRQEGALEAAAETGAAVCLVHMQGEPRTMQEKPHYDDVVSEVHRFLAERLFTCQLAGIDKKKLIIDPGFGFGKTLEHNVTLLRELSRFASLDVPILVGLSRKSLIGTLIHRSAGQRVYGSVAAALIAIQRGASIVRVHDVGATRDALAIWNAVKIEDGNSSKKLANKSVNLWDDD